MQLLRRFLADLDAQWTPLSSEPQVLPIIGAGALMLRTRYERGTKDGDILQTRALDDRWRRRGRDTMRYGCRRRWHRPRPTKERL